MKQLRDIKVFIYLSFIALIAFLISLYPGTVTIEWFKTKFTVPVAAYLALTFLFCGVLLTFHHLLLWIRYLPLKSKAFFEKRRERHFEELLLDGLTSLASQEYEEANEISLYLKNKKPQSPIVSIIEAQVSYLNKKSQDAETSFAKMSLVPETRFLGLRGLSLLALEKNEHNRAEHILNDMLKIRPQSPWVQNLLEKYYLNQTLISSNLIDYKKLPLCSVKSHHDAIQFKGLLLWSHLDNHPDFYKNDREYYYHLKEVYKLIPNNISIAVKLAKYQYEKIGYYQAVKTLKSTFKINPHREIGWCYLSHLPKDKKKYRFKLLQRFVTANPFHQESAWLLAKTAFDHQLWNEARYHISPLLEDHLTKEVCQLMLDIEIQQFPYEPEKHKLWRDSLDSCLPQWHWICMHCKSTYEHAHPVCTSCGEFGKMVWDKVSQSSPLINDHKLVFAEQHLL